MARLQILELPEGADDSRPPFVLVVDQCEPQRLVVGIDQRWQDHWQMIADRIDARAVIVTPDTVEIPANTRSLDVPFELVADVEHMDRITDALGIDRLRDWDEIVSAIEEQRRAAAEGGHLFDEPGYQDPQRCARCGLDRGAWIFQRDTRTCNTVRSDAESGHDFRPLDPRDGLACLRCGMSRIEWAVRRDTPTCDEVRAAKGGA